MQFVVMFYEWRCGCRLFEWLSMLCSGDVVVFWNFGWLSDVKEELYGVDCL